MPALNPVLIVRAYCQAQSAQFTDPVLVHPASEKKLKNTWKIRQPVLNHQQQLFILIITHPFFLQNLISYFT